MAYGELYPTTQFQPSLLGDGLGGTGYQAGESSFMSDYWEDKAAREAAFQRPQGQYTSYGLTDPNAPDPATETNQTGVSGALAANQDVYGPRTKAVEGDGWSPRPDGLAGGSGVGNLSLPSIPDLSGVFDVQPYLDDAMGLLSPGMQRTANAWGRKLSGDESATENDNFFGGILGDNDEAADYLDRDYMTPGKLSAENWDWAQKGLGLGGAAIASALTPVGMIAGQYGRGVANDAYREAFAADEELGPYRGDIGFWEDILQPDFLFGSPEDQHREAYIGAMVNADNKWAGANPNVTVDWSEFAPELPGMFMGIQDETQPKSLLDIEPPKEAPPAATDGGAGYTPTHMQKAQEITDNALWSPLSVEAVARELANPRGSFSLGPRSITDPSQMRQQVSREEQEKVAQQVKSARIAREQAAAQAAAQAAQRAAQSRATGGWGQSGQGGMNNTSTSDYGGMTQAQSDAAGGRAGGYGRSF